MRFSQALAVVFVALGCGVSAAMAQTYDPAVADWSGEPLPPEFRFDTPEPIAMGWDTGVSFSAAGQPLARDPRIDALSEALDHDVDAIFEYVRNHIRTTPTFGLAKGAFGAMLDEAGNPFDQAHLLVELLNAADDAAATSFNARFVYGTVTQSAAEFTDVFGPQGARGACELLAAGGIPAQINGSTTSCTSLAVGAPLTSVAFRHVWVRVSIGGQDYDFDPSLKEHVFLEPDATTLNSVPSAATLTGSASRSTLSGDNVQALSGYQTSSISQALVSATPALRNAIALAETGIESAEFDPNLVVHNPIGIQHVLGGFDRINLDYMFEGGSAGRLTTLPGHVQLHTWSEIPDVLRAFIHISAYQHPANGSVDVSVPLASVAGRRLWVAESSAIDLLIGDDPTTTELSILLDEQYMQRADSTNARAVVGTYAQQGLPYFIDLAIHYPFFDPSLQARENARSWYQYRVNDAFPSYIALGIGERGAGAEARNAGEIAYPGYVSWKTMQNCVPEAGNCNLTVHRAQLNSVVRVAERFLTHATRSADLFEGVGSVRRASHHLVGVAGVVSEMNPYDWPIVIEGVEYYQPSVAAQNLALNFSGRAGLAHLTSSPDVFEPYAFSVSSTWSALEQLVVQSVSDAPSVDAVPSMFAWFQNSSIAEAYNATVGADYQIRWIEVPEIAQSAARDAAMDRLWIGPDSPMGIEYSHFAQHEDYTVVTPQSQRVGPARLSLRTNGSISDRFPAFWGLEDGLLQFNPSPSCTTVCDIEDFDAVDAYSTRLWAYLAYRSDSESIGVAPYSRGLKGGGGASFPSTIDAPMADREQIDEAYESWASSFNVDLRTGGLTVTPPADISIGAGDGALAFQRSYSSDRAAVGPLGPGWTHNFDVSLTTDTDLNAAFSRGNARSALATILAVQATWELFEQSSDYSRDFVSAMLVQDWWVNSVFDNAARIERGAASETFVRQPDDIWQPIDGGSAQLTRTGMRVAEANQTIMPANFGALVQYVTVSEAFDRRAWVFQYTSPTGSVEQYTYGFDLARGAVDPRWASQRSVDQFDATNAIGSGNSFLRRSVSAPASPDLIFSHTSLVNSHGYAGEWLSSATIGAPYSRTLSFAYEGVPNLPPDPHGTGDPENVDPHGRTAGLRLASVTSSDSRSVSFGYEEAANPSYGQQYYPRHLASFTNVQGEVTHYSSSHLTSDAVWLSPHPIPYTSFGNGVHDIRYRLTSINMPTDASADLEDHFMEIFYDEMGRVVRVENGRDSGWHFYVGEGARGRQRDPINFESRTYFDREGRQFASINHADIVSRVEMDALGRVVFSDLGPSMYYQSTVVDRTETFYDAWGNVVLSRLLPRVYAHSPYAGDPIETLTYYDLAAFPTLPTYSVDPLGAASLNCYSPSQPDRGGLNRCSQVQSPAAGEDGLLRGTFGPEGEVSLYEYDAVGRMTRARTLVEE